MSRFFISCCKCAASKPQELMIQLSGHWLNAKAGNYPLFSQDTFTMANLKSTVNQHIALQSNGVVHLDALNMYTYYINITGTSEPLQELSIILAHDDLTRIVPVKASLLGYFEWHADIYVIKAAELKISVVLHNNMTGRIQASLDIQKI